MPERVLVTGATGFVGNAVARRLVARGDRVRVLVRPGADRRLLAGLDVEPVAGDLRDPASLDRAMAGVETCYHVAASYRLWSPDPRELYESNVTGTRNLLAAAERAGVRRVVYTSTVGTLGVPKGGVGTETTPVGLADMVGHYKRSKFLAEREAEAAAARGVPVVIVNPSTPVGPGDVKPTPTGQIIVDFLNGRMPAYVDTGLNLIDVEDVAAGHLLAAARGRVGEKYILGHRNLWLAEILAILARIAGRPAPRLKLPLAAVLPLAWASQVVADRVTRRPPRIPLEGVRMARRPMFFDAAKAVRELGLPQSPVEAALERAVRWFEAHGYVRRDRGGGPARAGG
ncbi:MAG TPA: hopanoid-associated sugar epimerase [Thermodesulfobacteriota bacterium]|nr:hopanoid-associated sugar epimerase [Thermodesulfobacteriota bacterium]